MSTERSDVAAELWALAETVMIRLEPVLRQAMEDQRDRPRQGCTWCPVCALAALVRGEQHDLLTLVATEGATVVAALRRILAEHAGETTGDRPAPPAETDVTPGDGGVQSHGERHDVVSDTVDPVVGRSGFVPINVTVKGTADPQQ